MSLWLFLISCIGLTFIVTVSYVFSPLRQTLQNIHPMLGKFIKCTQCVGFWTGLIIRCLDIWYHSEFIDVDWSVLYNVCYGFAGSFVSYSSYLLLKFFMQKYD